MALLDLSQVTTALLNLVEHNIEDHLDPTIDVQVTAQPPDKVTSPSNVISVYLYHVHECMLTKNAAGPGSDIPNIPTAPMGLVLYYIVTAHHEGGAGEYDALTQQKLMGYVLKTFHDYPVVTDNTRIGGVAILPSGMDGGDNTLQIIMRPVPVEEAVSFWSAESEQPPRLSAYYKVQTVMLEPEAPRRIPGRVLSLGTYLVNMRAPQLVSTQSVVSFTLPEDLGGLGQRLMASPGRVVPGPGGTSDPLRHVLLLDGSDLTGYSQSLKLNCRLWSEQTPSVGRVNVSADPSWEVGFLRSQVTAKFQSTVAHESGSLDVLPGLYTARVDVVTDRKVVAGQLREVGGSSNEIGFLVTPKVESYGAPEIATNRITVTVADTFDLTDSRLSGLIGVVVNGQSYDQVSAFGDPPNAGTFIIASAHSLTFEALFDVSSAGSYPFRLVVNGADAPPFWIELEGS